MILPLPSAPMADESSIRFIDLSGYDRFFDDLNSGFPHPSPPPLSVQASRAGAAVGSPIQVHQVGDFVASFVPTMKDFDRLDARFVIPANVWEKIPGYSDFSFAVFQLKQPKGETHPMAFEFKTRMHDQVFFPTVHIHDGEVHETEHFEHQLYCQNSAFDEIASSSYTHRPDVRTGLVRSNHVASKFVDVEKSLGLVDSKLLVHRKTMNGNFRNTDVVLQARPGATVGASEVRHGRHLAATAALLPVGWILSRRIKLQHEKRGEFSPAWNEPEAEK